MQPPLSPFLPSRSLARSLARMADLSINSAEEEDDDDG